MHQETVFSTPTIECTYEGFGSVSPNSKVASAKFRWLTALRKQPEYYQNITDPLKRRASFNFNRNEQDSMINNISVSDSELIVPTPTRRLTFETSTPRRVTRSRGKPIELENVQSKTIEYRKSNKQIGK